MLPTFKTYLRYHNNGYIVSTAMINPQNIIIVGLRQSFTMKVISRPFLLLWLYFYEKIALHKHSLNEMNDCFSLEQIVLKVYFKILIFSSHTSNMTRFIAENKHQTSSGFPQR